MQLLLAQVAFFAAVARVLCLSPLNLDNYIQRTGHAVVRLGDFLYIDGGTIEQFEGDHTDPSPDVPVNTTLTLPLASAWTNSSLQLATIQKPDTPPMYHPLLDADYNNTQIWRLTADGAGGGFWQFEYPKNLTQVLDFQRAQRGSFATCFNTGFYLGGLKVDIDPVTKARKRLLVPGLLTHNLTSQTWANESATAFATFGTSYGGEAVCVPPFGPNGLVLFLGGVTSKGLDFLDADKSLADSAGVDFDNLTFYDPFKKEWHSQEATGNRPSPRQGFCAVGVQGPNTTYEIYLYAGMETQSSNRTTDMYVLSLPGFVWFKASGTFGPPRAFHRCVALGDSQMVTVGGWVNLLLDQDPWLQGIGVVDLPSMSLKNSYDPKAAAYDSPKVVNDWYNNGGLASVSWSSYATKSLFLNSRTY
ncbi:hypothetical protein GQ53DRAFT_829081 [Thozetella sp. PMI_491]|nr:hypothetical protein GQ53DRAFT_829081 [Thozetella sp. PMI_491]